MVAPQQRPSTVRLVLNAADAAAGVSTPVAIPTRRQSYGPHGSHKLTKARRRQVESGWPWLRNLESEGERYTNINLGAPPHRVLRVGCQSVVRISETPKIVLSRTTAHPSVAQTAYPWNSKGEEEGEEEAEVARGEEGEGAREGEGEVVAREGEQEVAEVLSVMQMKALWRHPRPPLPRAGEDDSAKEKFTETSWLRRWLISKLTEISKSVPGLCSLLTLSFVEYFSRQYSPQAGVRPKISRLTQFAQPSVLKLETRLHCPRSF